MSSTISPLSKPPVISRQALVENSIRFRNLLQINGLAGSILSFLELEEQRQFGIAGHTLTPTMYMDAVRIAGVTYQTIEPFLGYEKKLSKVPVLSFNNAPRITEEQVIACLQIVPDIT